MFSPKALVKHIKEVHREEPFKCDVCNQDFYVKSEFEKHTQNSGECDPLLKAKLEMLQCLDCGKQECYNEFTSYIILIMRLSFPFI